MGPGHVVELQNLIELNALGSPNASPGGSAGNTAEKVKENYNIFDQIFFREGIILCIIRWCDPPQPHQAAHKANNNRIHKPSQQPHWCWAHLICYLLQIGHWVRIVEIRKVQSSIWIQLIIFIKALQLEKWHQKISHRSRMIQITIIIWLII